MIYLTALLLIILNAIPVITIYNLALLDKPAYDF